MRKETRCRHIGYSYRLTARVLLYAPSHRQDSTYHGLCYTSRGALAGTRNSSIGPPHEGSIRRPIAPRANALTTELQLAPEIAQWVHSKEGSIRRPIAPRANALTTELHLRCPRRRIPNVQGERSGTEREKSGDNEKAITSLVGVSGGEQ